ncbi:MAG: hypothetical protein RIB84_15550 [Sneathiellaceae bacterium]
MELETVAVDDVHPRSFRPILTAWYRQRRDQRCPLRADLQPFLVPAMAGNALLFGVDGDSYTYRLVGENIRQAVRQRLKGRTAAEVLGEDTDYYRLVASQFRLVVTNMRPLYSMHRLHRPGDSQQMAAWRIVLPYRDGETVTRLLTYQVFDAAANRGGEVAVEDLLPHTVFWVAAPV